MLTKFYFSRKLRTRHQIHRHLYNLMKTSGLTLAIVTLSDVLDTTLDAPPSDRFSRTAALNAAAEVPTTNPL